MKKQETERKKTGSVNKQGDQKQQNTGGSGNGSPATGRDQTDKGHGQSTAAERKGGPNRQDANEEGYGEDE